LVRGSRSDHDLFVSLSKEFHLKIRLMQYTSTFLFLHIFFCIPWRIFQALCRKMILHVAKWNFLTRRKTRPVIRGEEIDTCAICSETIGELRQDGTTEVAYTLPCSHTFGNICIMGWLDVAPQKDCPICRRHLIHPGCGHIIMPHKLSTAPPSIPEEETPAKCLRCRGKGAVAEALRVEQEHLELQEKALRGMKVHLPKFFGTQASTTLGTVDQRIAELRKGFAVFHERTWRNFEGRERRELW
jgi:hypothetical protein